MPYLQRRAFSVDVGAIDFVRGDGFHGKGRGDEFVEHHSVGENVDFVVVRFAALIANDLRCHEAGRAAEGADASARLRETTYAEIGEFYVDAVRCRVVGKWEFPYENVGRFQVEIDDAVGVQISQAARHLQRAVATRFGVDETTRFGVTIEYAIEGAQGGEFQDDGELFDADSEHSNDVIVLEDA